MKNYLTGIRVFGWRRWLAAAASVLLACGSASAAGAVRNVFEFRVPQDRHWQVGEWQRDKSPTYHVGNYLIDGRVVGSWDISKQSEAQRVFRTEVTAQPGQKIAVSVHVTRTTYGPMTIHVNSKSEDTLWLVEWFIDSINVVGSRPLGAGATSAAPVAPSPQSHTPAASPGHAPSQPPTGNGVSGIDSIDPLGPVNFNLRKQWLVREHRPDGRIWQGVWVRRGSSHIFDATWRLDGTGNPVKDVVEVRGVYGGNIVEIYRQGTRGFYRGPLTSDKRGVARGTATWYSNEWWDARFVDSAPSQSPPVTDGHGSAGPDRSGGVWHMAGSYEASAQVFCLKGTERFVNNYVRSCTVVGDQTFNRVTHRNPGMPPTTEPVVVRSGNIANFDRYGYLL